MPEGKLRQKHSGACRCFCHCFRTHYCTVPVSGRRITTTPPPPHPPARPTLYVCIPPKFQESYGESPHSLAVITNHAIARCDEKAPRTAWTLEGATLTAAATCRQGDQPDKDAHGRNVGSAAVSGKEVEANRERAVHDPRGGEVGVVRADDSVTVDSNDRRHHVLQDTMLALQPKTSNVQMYTGATTAAGATTTTTTAGGIAAKAGNIAGCFDDSRTAEAAEAAATAAASSTGKYVSRYGGRFACGGGGRKASATVTDSGAVMATAADAAAAAAATARVLHMNDVKQVSAPFGGHVSMATTISPRSGFVSKDKVRRRLVKRVYICVEVVAKT